MKVTEFIKSRTPVLYAVSIRALIVSAALATDSNVALAAANGDTTSIKRDSESAKSLQTGEPSYQTREQRLNAKPLDWNSTIGKPKRRAQSPTEKQVLQKAKPESEEGGTPNPNADEEARKLHPEEWKSYNPNR